MTVRQRAVSLVAVVLVAVALVAVATPAGADAPRPAHAFVHLDPALPYDAGVAAVRAAGVRVAADLPAAHVAYVVGSGPSVARLDRVAAVVRLEEPPLVEPTLDVAPLVSRARQVYEVVGGEDQRVFDDAGDPVDGSGVGIAIVDSGIDATHPDLRWAGLDGPGAKVARNLQVDCSVANLPGIACEGELVMDERADTDTGDGHGTQMAGVAAGSGTASDGRYLGVAPGATLYGLGIGDGVYLYTTWIAFAFQWLYDHGLDLDPPVRVVNNSWGATGSYDPDDTLNKLVTALVEDRGMTVVFAAGNYGGDGSEDRTNRWAKNPTPGVLAIANYDHLGTGTREGELAYSSSRGLATDPATWPTIAAPSERTVSTCQPVGIYCTPTAVHHDWDHPTRVDYHGPWYSVSGGTSAASAHTAGVVALLSHADPDITPAEVERALVRSAYKFTFGAPFEPLPDDPELTTSYDKGHGLVDALAAVTLHLAERETGLP